MSIFQLPSLVEQLPGPERALFDRIFEVDSCSGRVELEKDMHGWAREKFGDLQEVENQKIIKVTNLVTGEGSLFNYLRERRPLCRSSEQDLDALVEKFRPGCPFCSPERFAPRDPFGRVRGEYCITAANVAKYDGYHGLVIPREHHPLHFDEHMVEDYFATAARWFMEAGRHAGREGNGKAHYPFLMWNCLWPAGSSVVHGHLQLTVTRGRHYPRVEHLCRSARQYRQSYGSDYFEDVAGVYRALGLAREEGEMKLNASLTPVKERETWVVMPPGPPKPGRMGRLGKAVCGVLDTFKHAAGLESFNVAVYLPPLAGGTGGWEDFPLIARVVDRGSISSRTADFGAMELYAASVVSSDPFQVARLLKNGSYC